MPSELPFANAIPDRIIWVSPDGDDNNSGSQDSPLHSIQLAMDRAAPGTAILLQPGTYTGNFEFQSIQGTTDKPIWLAAAGGPGTATIVAASNDVAVITIQGEDNIVIRDLNISGGYSGIQVSQSGSNYTDLVNNIWIEGNTITGSVVDGLKISQTTNIHVLNNTIDNAGGEGIDFVGVINGTISGNEISNTRGAAGLFVKGGSSDVSIADNYVHDVLGDGIDVGGWSSFLYPGTNYEAKNVTVTGNVVEDASRRPLGVLGGQNVDIHDNHFGTISSNTYAVFVGTGGPDLSSPPVSKNVSIHDNVFDRSQNFSMVQSGSTSIAFADNAKNGVIEGDMRPPAADPASFADTLPDDLVDAAAWATSARYTHTITGNSSANSLTGTIGNDYLAGGGGNDTMAGGRGDDTYEIGSSKDLAVEQPGQGADTAQVWTSSYTLAANVENLFVKTAGGGTFIGNELNNILTSGRGNDAFTGGAGDDLIVFAPGRGHDTITDFDPGAASHDTIDLTAFTSLVSLADVLALASQVGANTVLSFSTGETLTLANVAASSLVAEDFILTRQPAPPPPPNVAPTDVGLTNGEVAEGAPVGTVVGTLSATDADSGETFTYALASDPSGLFAIDGDHLVVAGGLDFETAASHTITVQVTDSANNTFDKVMTIGVSDVAPSTPTDSDEAENVVADGAATGTAVGISASAADPNGGALTYALLDDAGGRFAIEASTGVVTVADGSLIDYAEAQEHAIVIQASDASGAASTTGFTIAVAPPPPPEPVADTTPSTPEDSNTAANVVREGAAAGTLVGISVVAAGFAGGAVGYSLLDDAGGRFAIDATTGAVTVANGSLLDYESATALAILVRATGADGATSETTFAIDVANVAGATITGGTGNETIDGTHTIKGQTFATNEEDVIKGGAGSDTIEGLGGRDTLMGGSGTDTLTYAHGQAGVSVSLATGLGHGGDAEGDMVSEFENLTGSAYNDVLEGNGGSNRLNGGAGVDTLTYEHATGSIRLSLATAGTQSTGGAGGDLVSNFENLTGSNFNDFLTGNSGNNVLTGLGGNDVINGGAGNDTLIGGFGRDTMTGGAGADTFVLNSTDERIDTITDFSSGIDSLQISAAGFGGGLTAGGGATLAIVTDVAKASAEAGHGYFIYDNSGTNAGLLYWDPTGGPSDDAIVITLLKGTAALSASDFHLV